jgi:hypothetical protein
VGVAQGVVDHGQDAFEVLIDVIVPETQYCEASAGEVIVALRIPPGMRIEVMLATIDLYKMSRCLKQRKSRIYPSSGAWRRKWKPLFLHDRK